MDTRATIRVGISSWQGRVAPVFDSSRCVDLFAGHADDLEFQGVIELPDDPWAKTAELKLQAVGVLICGAISRPLHDRLTELGIEVCGFVAGELGQVLAAWAGRRLEGGAFTMPGCCGGHRRRHRGAGEPAACRCPRCGRREPHAPGQPCRTQLCPTCHCAMTHD